MQTRLISCFILFGSKRAQRDAVEAEKVKMAIKSQANNDSSKDTKASSL